MVLSSHHIHRLSAQALGNQRKGTRRNWHQLETTVTDKEGPLSAVYKWQIKINPMDD